MPTYTYRCSACGLTDNAFRRISERNDAPVCPREGHGPMERVLTPPMLAVFQPYLTPAFDKESGERQMIRSRAEHEAFLRRNGLEEVGNDKSFAPVPAEEAAYRKREKIKEMERDAALSPPAEFDFNRDTHEATL